MGVCGGAAGAARPLVRSSPRIKSTNQPTDLLSLMQAHGLRDFLLPMLSFAPGRRASAAQALAHPWLRGELPQPPPAEGPRGGGQGHGGGHRRDDRSKSAVRSRSPRRSRSPSR